MKNRTLLLCMFFCPICLFAQPSYGIGGSVSIRPTLGFEALMDANKGRFYLSVAREFAGTHLKVVRERKSNYGTTSTGSGNYFWVADFGYGRVVWRSLLLSVEAGMGQRNAFTNYKDNRFRSGGYSLITSSDILVGAGARAWWSVGRWEPWIGLHTHRRLAVGVVYHLDDVRF